MVVVQTTFIKYLLERDFPGAHIGPEPTTDRFVAVMYGKDERIIPGNALAADASKPFTALNKFGMAFLNKFECSQCDSPILEKISFVDTPGVLSGEKQRIGRAYNFPELIEWFAERADRYAQQQHSAALHSLHSIDGVVRRERGEGRMACGAERDGDDEDRHRVTCVGRGSREEETTVHR